MLHGSYPILVKGIYMIMKIFMKRKIKVEDLNSMLD